MDPVEFLGSNVVYAKDQKEYRPMPARMDSKSGFMTTCWKLTPAERLKVLVTGVVWHQMMTFGNPPYPQLPAINKPEF